MTGHPPIVRIEIDHMRQSIIHAFADYQLQVSGDVQRALDKAIAAFDFKGEVARIAYALLQDHIKTAIQGAIYEVMASPEMRKEVAKIFSKILSEKERLL
jgi:hypothetical protein